MVLQRFESVLQRSQWLATQREELAPGALPLPQRSGPVRLECELLPEGRVFRGHDVALLCALSGFVQP
jgi:hypothetical protein